MPAFAPTAVLADPQLLYRFDAALSLTMAIGFAALATPLAVLIGWPSMATIITGAAIFLLPWALFNWAIGSAGRPDRLSIVLNLSGDALWVLLSLALLALHSAQMSPIGVTLIIGQALTVSTNFALKALGLRHLPG